MKTLLKHPYWLVCFAVIVIYSAYQLLITSDRYVSTAYIVLDSPSMATPRLDYGAILSGSGGSGDLLLLREHLLSTDMLRKLDAKLNLRQHYSNSSIDYLSRLSAEEVPIETFHDYYLSRVEVELDEYSHVLRVNTQAFEPDMALAIISLLLSEGEAHMNAMGQRLAEEQVRFIEKQVDILAVRLGDAREALLTYQNKYGLISPRASVESRSAIVASLEGELATLQARRQALSATRSENAADMIEMRAKIDALQNQIVNERAKMATQSGDALNRITVEYETLELQAQFALDLYSAALTTLESTRVEAVRQLKQISVLQAPSLPEYSTEPNRAYNITVFTILAVLASVIAQLMALIIRDHRD